MRKPAPQPEDLRQEFEAKNEILRSKFLEISPLDYIKTVFPDKDENDEVPVIFGAIRDEEREQRGTVKRIRFSEIWKVAWYQNAYLSYCDFKKNYYHSKTLERVRGFVVDCDGVTSTKLTKILRYLWNFLPAEPTHIVNSGQGVHFVYLLSKPVEVRGLRWSINRLNKAIQESFSEFLEVDKHPVVHPYRFPGFQTKINTTARVFKVRDGYSFEELLEKFKITSRKMEKKERKTRNKAEVYVLPNGKRAFFEWVLRRLFKNPPIPGRRQNSFFALGIIAYKCKREVPYTEALETIPMIYEDMMDRNLHIGFTIDEAYKAFHKGYTPKYVLASWRYLCELLGWEYKPNKRNGLSRKEHCRYMNYIKSAKAKFRREMYMPKVKELLEDGWSIRKISSLLGVPKSTLSRWIKQEKLGL